jgi:hypothetical protein
MPRHALRAFFAAALPLVLAGCPLPPCPEYHATIVIDGGVPDGDCKNLCVQLSGATGQGEITNVDSCVVTNGDTITCSGTNPCYTGRRPDGFASAANGFARMAELEAASVHAFHILADELRALGAPASLIVRARRSAREEARHARIMGRLAAARPRVERPPARIRSAAEIAVENVREGCVRETFGAAQARVQASVHPDPRVRDAMRAIFPDEERHAELAHDVHAWLVTRLDDEARARVEAARREALDELSREFPSLRALVDAIPS